LESAARSASPRRAALRIINANLQISRIGHTLRPAGGHLEDEAAELLANRRNIMIADGSRRIVLCGQRNDFGVASANPSAA
jgi:hypothetical protein